MFKRLILISLIASLLFSVSLSPLSLARADSSIPPIQRLGTGIPTSIAASPDGKTLAVGTSIGVWLLDAMTLQPFDFLDTGVWVYNVSYSVDGKYLRANDHVYDMTIGQLVNVDIGQTAWINHLCAFDGKFCVRNLASGQVYWLATQVVDMNTLIIVKQLEWPITDVAWSFNGTTLYDIQGGNIRARGTQNWQVSQVLGGFFTEELQAVFWSPDSSQIASGSAIWSVNSAQVTGQRECPYYYYFPLQPFPCERFPLLWNRDSVQLYTLLRNEWHYFAPHHILLTSATLSSDKQLIVTSGVDHITCEQVDEYGRYGGCSVVEMSLRIWDASTFNKQASLPLLFFILAISPDNKVVIGHTETTLEAWDWHTGQKLWSVDEKIGSQCNFERYSGYYSCRGSSGSIAIDPNGRFVATENVATGNAIWLYNLLTGEFIASFSGHTSYITDISFSPDGSQLAASSLDGTILIWPVP